MNIKEYIPIVKKTEIYPEKVNVVYLYLGLTGELSELRDSLEDYNNGKTDINSVVQEVGDVMWYIVSISERLNISTVYLVNNFKEIISNVGIVRTDHIAEDIKKYYRDGKPIDKIKVMHCLGYVLYSLEDFLSVLDYTIEEILQLNYDKLTKRFNESKLHGDGSNR